MRVREATPADIDAWAALRAALWPDESAIELREEAAAVFAGTQKGQALAAVFLAESEGRPCGMIELSLRLYAEGCTDSPVPYVEAWYVAPEHRGRAVGRALMIAAEDWARAQGLTELASDALLDNIASQRAHAALGFAEVERTVHFRKALTGT